MKPVIWSVLTTIVVLAAIPFVVLATGMVNMGASDAPGTVEKAIATFAVDRSLAVRAPNETSKLLDDRQAISAGSEHYATMCVRCHGGPGLEAEEFAKGLNPPAPNLESVAEEFTDGELFWITKHGIRMTGMPAFGATHNDADIWKIVAFMRHLDELTEDQRSHFREAVASGQRHHGESTDSAHEHDSSSPFSSPGHHDDHEHSAVGTNGDEHHASAGDKQE